ncbi:MAG TPA: hypothetical protein VH989_00455 [Actinomycetota bacterium]
MSTTWGPRDEDRAGGAALILDLTPAHDVRIDAGTKGFPALTGSVRAVDVAAAGWSLPRDLRAPVMTLRATALDHNLALMASFCRNHDVDLVPHGKTTMAPQLWDRQLEAGAWGITAATVAQAAVMRSVRVPRILLANELVDGPSIDWVAAQLGDPDFDFVCYVDSLRGVAILEERLGAAGAPRPLGVLVEIGHEGGRTGCRTVDAALEVAGAVAASKRLELAGAAGYEGTIGEGRSLDAMTAVSAFVDRLGELARGLLERGAVRDGAIVSAGGSVFFDVVADRLREALPEGSGARIALRSGCYLTHDHGTYERNSPFSGRADPALRFHPAIELWGRVLSRPEPSLALLGFGRRDAPFDTGMPVPLSIHSPSGDPTRAARGIEVERLNDQHAFCRVDPKTPLEVGELVACGISHPCTAFDKWRVLPVVDDHLRVVDAVATFF